MNGRARRCISIYLLNDTKYNGIKGKFRGFEKVKDIVYTWIKKEDLVHTLVKPDYVVEQILNDKNSIQFLSCIE